MSKSKEPLQKEAQNLLSKLISKRHWLASNKVSKFRPAVEKEIDSIQEDYWQCLRKINNMTGNES